MDERERRAVAWVLVAVSYALLTVWGWTQSLPEGMTLAQAFGLD